VRGLKQSLKVLKATVLLLCHKYHRSCRLWRSVNSPHGNRRRLFWRTLWNPRTWEHLVDKRYIYYL